MTTSTRYTLVAALLALAVFLAGWFLLVGPKRTEASDLKAQTASAQEQNAALQTQIKKLEAQAADLPAQQARLAEIRTQIPDAPSLPSLIRSLTAIGASAGVDVRSLTPGEVEPVELAAPAPAASPAAGETTDTAAAATSTGAAPVGGTVAASGDALVAIPLDIQVFGSYFDVEQFLNEAEELTRAMLITGMTIVPLGDDAPNPGDLDATFNARVFMTQAQADAAVAAVPAG